MGADYPDLLQPDGTKTFRGREFLTASAILDQWSGEPMADSWGGKAAIRSRFTQEALFAELALREMAADSEGWSSRWVEAYGAPWLRPHLLTSWPGHRDLASAYAPIDNDRVNTLMAAIAEANGRKHSGVWDVLAWHERSGRVVFFESKRRGKDAIRDSQIRWAEAAVAAGLPADSLVVVEWDFHQ